MLKTLDHHVTAFLVMTEWDKSVFPYSLREGTSGCSRNLLNVGMLFAIGAITVSVPGKFPALVNVTKEYGLVYRQNIHWIRVELLNEIFSEEVSGLGVGCGSDFAGCLLWTTGD